MLREERYLRPKDNMSVVQHACAQTTLQGAAGAHRSSRQPVNLTPNLAIAEVNGSYVAVGGQHRVGSNLRSGVWMAWSKTLEFAPGAQKLLHDDSANANVAHPSYSHVWRVPLAAPAAHWHSLQWIMDGLHEGCVERRESPWLHALKSCEFDGRLSVVFHRNAYLLYARANAATKGERFVQVARSVDRTALSWSPFRMISIRNYVSGDGNLYFFAVQANPVHAGSLIAVFPLVHQLKGCIGLATSRDGVRWSSVVPLVRCRAHGERTEHHPASPAIVRDPVDGQSLLLYIQEHVPGIYQDAYMPKPMNDWLQARAPVSRVVQYRIPPRVLEDWTQRSLAELPDDDVMRVS